MAISEAISSLFKAINPKTNFTYVNWERLTDLDGAQHKNSIFVVAGGGYFFIKTDGRLPSRLKVDLDFFKSTGINPILFGVGLNIPGKDDISNEHVELKPDDENTIRGILSCSRLISVRDSNTKEFLKNYTNKPIYIIGDPAIYLGKSIFSNPAPTQTTGSQLPTIGVNIPFHGPSSNKILKSNIEKYIQLLKSIQSTTGCRYKYFVHYDSEYIIPKLLHTKNLDIETVAGTPSELLSEYIKLNLHLGGMLHSCIMAHSVGIPCISLAYDIKHRGFFELMGTENNYFSALDFEPDAVLKRSLFLLKNQDQVRQDIYNRVDFYSSKIIDFGKQCLNTF